MADVGGDAMTWRIAVYGVRVSTPTFLWKVYTDLRDTGCLKVSVLVGRIHTGEYPAIHFHGDEVINLSERDQIFITVAARVLWRPEPLFRTAYVMGREDDSITEPALGESRWLR